MKILGILLVLLMVGCAVEMTNASEQTLCTIEDQQSASCPDSVWRIPYTRDAWRSVTGLSATPNVECSNTIAGLRQCKAQDWVSIDSYVYTYCVFDFGPMGPWVSCSSVRCTVSYPPFPNSGGPMTTCNSI